MQIVLPVLLVLFVLMLAISGMILIVSKAKRLPASRILFAMLICWLSVYLIALVYVTILSRSSNDAAVSVVNLIPFQELLSIFRQHRYIDLELYLFNIIMYLPEGVLMCCILNHLKKNSWRSAVTICFGTILPIELVQALAARGIFDIDDILCNFIGFLLGYLLAKAALSCFCPSNRGRKPHLNS